MVLIGMILLTALPAVAATLPPEWHALERYAAAAAEAVALGEGELARSHSRMALAEGRTLLGGLALAGDDLLAAEAELALAASAAPAQAIEARVALAATHAALGRLDEAVEELRLLARGFPGHTGARQQLVRALARSGAAEEAQAELAELGRLDPPIASALRAELGAQAGPAADPLAGLALLSRLAVMGTRERRALGERVEGAVAELEGGLAALRSSTAADLARRQLSAGAPEPPVEAELLAALEAEPGQLPPGQPQTRQPRTRQLQTRQRLAHRSLAHQSLARLYLAAGRHPEALEQLRHAAALGELERLPALVLAELERRDGRLGASSHQLRSLVERFDSTAAHLGLARNAVELGHAKAAADHARRALEGAPASEAALELHASVHLDAGLAPVAGPSVEVLARMRPDHAPYALLIGRVWMGLGEMGEASEALLRAVELDGQLLPARR
ncbi:MAG: hypothetical protein MI919_39045, partial [Holophagales bacterium]|nr:hypothetical protein [Holophagales bacterium]